MQRAIIVRGRLNGRTRIDLDEPVDEMSEVEVVLRAVERTEAAHENIFEFLRTLAPGTRTNEDIDGQVAAEREGWGDR